MNRLNKDEELFEALLVAASSEAMRRELDALPSNAELNALYKTDALDARIAKLINQESKRQNRERRFRSFGKLAAGIAIVFTVLTTVLMSVEATRVKIINAFLEWQSDHVIIEPGKKNSEIDDNDGIRRPTYLPEGFYEEETYSFGGTIEIVYKNNDGTIITLMQSPAEATAPHIDNEHSEYRRITISGNEAHLFIALDQDTYNRIVWVSDDILYNLASLIDCEELILIAESIN